MTINMIRLCLHLHLHLHDPDDDIVVHHHSRPDHTFTLDPIPYRSYEFHFLSSDPDEFSFSDVLVVDDGLDLLDDQENQVNFVIDLLHQHVEQSQAMSDGTTSNQNNNRVDLVSDALTDPGFGVIDGTHELDMDGLELDLGLGFGSIETHYGNSGFVVETIGGSDVEVDVGGDDDDFPVERRVSDSEDDDNGALAIDLNSGDEYGMDHVDGYDDEDEILSDIVYYHV
ncbi:hypothetical protein SLEP1_g48485 [Rubroshorea leprosula]|uniref:Uncharacterized protein n=1 Tax=Rubroshorea leprosula TaxID=152421 RepID=A0AAV5LUW8_9ROSI|nr:hypothetical protein SLEP1_g48485 [Rubroshorea leprosula]